MATDSALLTEHPRRRARALTPRKGPIARTVGLDVPFFADKNRAFWVLQSAGWIGYFMLRTLGGVANGVPAMFVVHALLLTATGYSLTLLLASLYRRLITMRALYTVILSLGAVLLASAAFSVIETWSNATFVKPGGSVVAVQWFGAILLNFGLLAAWSALYYGINYYLLLEEEIDQRAGSRARRRPRSWRCSVTSSTRISCSTRSTASRLWCSSSRPNGPMRCWRD